MPTFNSLSSPPRTEDYYQCEIPHLMDPFYFPNHEHHACLSCSPTDTVDSLETAMSGQEEEEAPLAAATSPQYFVMPLPGSVTKSPKIRRGPTHRRSEFVLIG